MMLELLWLFLTAPAVAGVVTEDDLVVWARELAPEIQADTGRTFIQIPPVAIQDRYSILWEALPSFGRSLRPAERVEFEHMLETSFAVYVPSLQRVFVIKETVEDAFARMVDERDSLAPFIRCALGHELVHALVDQRVRPAPTATADGFRMMDEGVATFVEDGLCAVREARDLNRSFLRMDGLSSADPTDVSSLRYGYAERFLRMVHGSAGWPAVWAAVADPPPVATMVDAVVPTLSLPWRDDRAIREALAPYTDRMVVDETTRTSATQWLSTLDANAVEPRWIFGGDGGLVVSARGRDIDVVLGVVHLTETALVGEWLRNRHERYSHGAVMQPFKTATLRTFFWSRGAWSLTTHGFDRGYVFSVTTTPPLDDYELSMRRVFSDERCAPAFRCRYLEMWGLRGNVLVGIATQGIDVQPLDLSHTIQEVVQHYPGERTPETEWPRLAWPRSSQPQETLRAGWLETWMERRLAAGRSCAAEGKRRLELVDPADVPQLADVSGRCAAAP